MAKKYLTAKELAEKLGLSVETIWRYTREKKIPAIVMGTRQYRYDPNRVLQELQNKSPTEGAVKETKTAYSPKAYTYDDYAALPSEPGYTVQLIDGIFVKEPAPIVHHQRVSRRLQRILEDYFWEHNPKGELFNAPIDLVLSDHSTVQPDLVFIGNARQLTNPKYLNVIPELVVEILSPSSKRTDTVRKLDLYCRHGISHYWIVDPEDGIIQAFKLKDDAYTVIPVGDEHFEHPDYPGLTFSLDELIAKPL